MWWVGAGGVWGLGEIGGPKFEVCAWEGGDQRKRVGAKQAGVAGDDEDMVDALPTDQGGEARGWVPAGVATQHCRRACQEPPTLSTASSSCAPSSQHSCTALSLYICNHSASQQLCSILVEPTPAPSQPVSIGARSPTHLCSHEGIQRIHFITLLV